MTIFLNEEGLEAQHIQDLPLYTLSKEIISINTVTSPTALLLPHCMSKSLLNKHQHLSRQVPHQWYQNNKTDFSLFHLNVR